MDVGPPVRAAATQGMQLGGSHHGLGNDGCCKVGEPAEESFDATARDDQHESDGRSLRETDRGGCRAAPGGRGICESSGGSVDFAVGYSLGPESGSGAVQGTPKFDLI
jgi:hypothetical protein